LEQVALVAGPLGVSVSRIYAVLEAGSKTGADTQQWLGANPATAKAHRWRR